MTFRGSLFSLCLSVLVCVPVAIADQQEAAAAATERVEASSCQRCGDGYCAPSCENERTCPADCKSTKVAAPAPAPEPVAASKCGRCGDGHCVKSCGETPESCPIDCGVSSESKEPPTETRCDADPKNE
jgi:hypothetical protein